MLYCTDCFRYNCNLPAHDAAHRSAPEQLRLSPILAGFFIACNRTMRGLLQGDTAWRACNDSARASDM